MKKIIIFFILLIMVTDIVGCAQKKEEISSNENVVTEEQENNDNVEIEETDISISTEAAHFDCMEEIKNASPEDGLVQIDDMLFQYGFKVSEALKVIEESKENYEFKMDCNENELVAPHDYIQVILLKDSDWYFELGADNSTDETIPLKDCLVENITAYRASKGNVYYAGFREDNDGAITYEYVKEAMKDCEIVEERSVYDNDGKRFLSVAYSIPSELSPWGKLYIYFSFESDTGELTAFKMQMATTVFRP